MRTCSVAGCSSKHLAKGLCDLHYQRSKNGLPADYVRKYERHGMWGTVEYDTWRRVLSRCYCHTNPDYASYGGRGISTPKPWLGSFLAFYRDVGPHIPGTELDRRDNSKGYSKENCRWVTHAINCQNRRDTKLRAADILEIRASRESDIELARWYGCTTQNIRCIKLRKTWRNVV